MITVLCWIANKRAGTGWGGAGFIIGGIAVDIWIVLTLVFWRIGCAQAGVPF